MGATRTPEGDTLQAVGRGAQQPARKTREMMFSRIDFADAAAHAALVMRRPGQKAPRVLGVRPRAAAHIPREPRRALEVLAARREQLAALERADPGRAARVRDDDAWMRAISRAQGVAVRDDVQRLKKSVALREKKKEKRAAGWDARKRRVDEEKAARVQRRQENIDKRRAEKKKHRKSKRR